MRALLAAIAAIAAGAVPASADGDFRLINMTQPWIDQDALLDAHRERASLPGEYGTGFSRAWAVDLEHLLWPSQADTARCSVPHGKGNAAARAECARELSVMVRLEYREVDLEAERTLQAGQAE